MAISGSLKDVKFIEILKIVGKRTGRLWIYNFDSNIYHEWFVHEHTVRAVRVNRVGQKLPDEIHQAAVALNEDTASQYIFYTQELTRLPSEISLPIEKVAFRLLSESVNYEIYRDQFPNPDTRFSASDGAKSEISGKLSKFWANCRLQLSPEFTAGEAAARFNISLEEAQFNFYKLRAAGIIKPVRVASYQKTLPGLPINSKNYDGISSPLQPQREITLKSANTSAPLPPSAIVNTERRGLVQRMLEALTLSKKNQ